MKKSLKFLALLLVLAVTFVSLPIISIMPAAEEATTDETVVYTFEDGTTGFAPLYGDAYEHKKVTTWSKIVTNAALSGDTSNKVLWIEDSAPIEGVTDAALGNMPEMFGPADDIVKSKFEEEKLLTSGSFDFRIARQAYYNQVIVFGMDENNYQLIHLGMRNGTDFRIATRNVSRNAEANFSTTNYNSFSAYSFASTQISTWINFEFYYSDDNKLNIKLYTDENNVIDYFRTNLEIDPKNRIFAFSTPYCVQSGGRLSYEFLADDVTLNFTPKPVTTVETVSYDFESDTPAFVSDAYTEHKHDNATVTYSRVSNKGMWNMENNHVGQISKVAKKSTADTVGGGNMSEFISPTKDVVDDFKNAKTPKYLASGGFDLYFSGDARTNKAFVFGLDETSYQYGILTVNRSYIKSSAFSQSLTEEATNWSYNQHQVLSGSSEAKWYHIDFKFGADNKLTVRVTNTDDVSAEWTYNIAVEPENRIFAFASPYHGNGRLFYFDNVVLNFANEGVLVDYPVADIYDQIVAFAGLQYTKETLELNPEKIVPYDIPRINKVATEYERYCEKRPDILEDDYFSNLNTKLPLLKAAVAEWGDVSTTEKVVESFYNLYFKDKEEVDYAKAYNIYRRLLKVERTAFEATYATEFAAMTDAIQNSGEEADKPIEIAAVGDSITHYGTWPEVLKNTLNSAVGSDKFAVYNYGESGKRILSDRGTYDFSVVDGDYRTQKKYYNSIASNPDIVLIMLGTNDANEVSLANSVEDTTFNSRRYAQYKPAYTDLIQSYLAMDCNAEIVIASPPRINNDNKGFDARVIALTGFLKEVAAEYDLKFVDVFEFSNESLADEDFSDTVHPTAAGSDKIGQFFADALLGYEMQDLNGAFLMTKIPTANGDANNDNVANIADLLRVRKYIADNSVEINLTYVDYDENGIIDETDYLALCSYLLNK